MADDPVVAERGVLTAPAEAWGLAVSRADMIRELAARPVLGSFSPASAMDLWVPGSRPFGPARTVPAVP